ncbi:hypothetical protein quinque_016069 [Culex quinquefasciatus]
MYGSQQPILVLSQNTKRDSGRKVQLENINAGKTIADLIRTCLGPQAMLKMLMDPMGGIVMTNDGNAILREITVQHPAAKSMIEIARTQDEEVGDGTTSVIVLAGEMLAVAEQFLQQQIHPTVIIRAYREALEDMIKLLQDDVSVPLDKADKKKLEDVVKSCVGTKFIGRWSDLAVKIALDAVETVMLTENGRTEIDIKKYAKVEKIPGGSIDESCVLRGVMLNKDVTHPKMRRYIEKPRIVLLDCPLEYKKGESQTNVEIDALHVARNLMLEPRLLPGGGAVEMAISQALTNKQIQGPYRAVAQALEIIPRTLAQNCGANTIRTLTALRAKHASHPAGSGPCTWGIDGESGQIVDMKERGIWEPLSVKLQVYKTAVETAILLLRIDDIVSGSKKANGDGTGAAPGQAAMGME